MSSNTNPMAEITSSINWGVYATMSGCVMVPLNFDSVTSIKTYDFLAGDPEIIDLESQYIANNDGYFSFSRFSYVFLNGKWVKTQLFEKFFNVISFVISPSSLRYNVT